MPLKRKYQKVLDRFVEQYGKDKGTKYFYSWVNKYGVKVD